VIEFARIGRAGVPITRLGLGCSSIGNLHRAMPDETARALADAARATAITLPQAALQFGLRHPAVAAVVVGAASAEEMRANAERFREPVPEAAWAELERSQVVRG
jgi:aryl-alcohol dehydrogenase-like predicted oxidoreductase